eukprot:COSAG06_NODE_4303_length_4382_cov_1.437310_8_plen_49_part_01
MRYANLFFAAFVQSFQLPLEVRTMHRRKRFTQRLTTVFPGDELIILVGQ